MGVLGKGGLLSGGSANCSLRRHFVSILRKLRGCFSGAQLVGAQYIAREFGKSSADITF